MEISQGWQDRLRNSVSSLPSSWLERFWAEIDAWARRILREVNILARAYGWRESDILALGAVRRQIYLTMAQAGLTFLPA